MDVEFHMILLFRFCDNIVHSNFNLVAFQHVLLGPLMMQCKLYHTLYSKCKTMIFGVPFGDLPVRLLPRPRLYTQAGCKYL